VFSIGGVIPARAISFGAIYTGTTACGGVFRCRISGAAVEEGPGRTLRKKSTGVAGKAAGLWEGPAAARRPFPSCQAERLAFVRRRLSFKKSLGTIGDRDQGARQRVLLRPTRGWRARGSRLIWRIFPRSLASWTCFTYGRDKKKWKMRLSRASRGGLSAPASRFWIFRGAGHLPAVRALLNGNSPRLKKARRRQTSLAGLASRAAFPHESGE
jgi:hypothetical protein